MLVGGTFGGNLDTDTGWARQFVTALSLVGWALGALPLLQLGQLAHLDACKVLASAQGGRAGPAISQGTWGTLVQEGDLPQRSAGLGAETSLSS